MNKNDMLDQYLMDACSADIVDICDCLKYIGADYFSYTMNHSNYYDIIICNNSGLQKDYFAKGLYRYDPILQVQNQEGAYTHLWSVFPNNPFYTMVRKNHHLSTGITLSMQEDNVFECWHFGVSAASPQAENYLVQNSHLLHKFKCYFMKKTQKYRQNLARAAQILKNYRAEMADCHSSKIKKLTQQMIPSSPDQIFFIADITDTEKQICIWLLYGKTAEDIAILMDLSKRTIEYHITRLKLNFQAEKLAELGYKLARNIIILSKSDVGERCEFNN